MSLNHEYAQQMLVADRQHTLLAEAAEARLARLATEGQPSWWQRLTHVRSAYRPVRPALRLRAHHSTGR